LPFSDGPARYRAKIILPLPARYIVHVRLNLIARTLENEIVTTRVVDIAERRVEGP